MFQFRRFPTYTYEFNARHHGTAVVGFPIRKFPDQWIFAPPRDLSQLIASFFGSQCQGIPLALFIAWPIENKLLIACSLLWIMQAFRFWNCNCYPSSFRMLFHNYHFTLALHSWRATSLLPYFTLLSYIVQFSRCSFFQPLLRPDLKIQNHLGLEICYQTFW